MVTTPRTAVKLLTALCIPLMLVAETAPSLDALKTITLYENPARRLPSEKERTPTNVSISLLISEISMDINKMQAEIIFYIKQSWQDSRLSCTSLRKSNQHVEDEICEKTYRKLFSSTMDNIWRPDIYVPNAVSTASIDNTAEKIASIVYANGSVVLDNRMKIFVKCHLDQYRFLRDSQYCTIRFESFAYTTKQLQLSWNRLNTVEFSANFIGRQRTINAVTQGDLKDCTSSRFTDTHSCLEVTLTLRMTNNLYMTQVYLPTTMIVILSWLTFWIDREAVVTRLKICGLCVFTILTHATGLMYTLPVQPGIKAIDVWQLICMSFVFLAILEFAVMHSMMWKKTEKKLKAAEESESEDAKLTAPVSNGDVGKKQETSSMTSRGADFSSLYKKWRSLPPTRIDKVSRVLFPVSFVVFNTIYWIMYFT